MSAAKVFAQLNTFYADKYRDIGLYDPNWIMDNGAITWANRLPMPAIDSYEELYQWKIDNNQSSLKIEEGIFQLYYKFSGVKVSAASVSFMASPELCEDYLRIDFDLAANKGAHHHLCHLHPSFCGRLLRIPVEKLQNPVAFIEFIVAMVKETDLNPRDSAYYWDTELNGICGYLTFVSKI